jgi:glycosyltransferase involved in cell wall biosynthesis
MGYHIRVLAGHVDRGAGSHVYHQQLVRRLAARGHRVSLVCFAGAPEVADCAEVYEVPKPAGSPPPFLWRFSALRDCLHCTRSLARLPLPAADVVIGGEHLFLKAHYRKFPQTPWIYLPHSLVVDQEIGSYHMPPLMQWVSTRLYVHLQRWALNHAQRTLRFTDLACDALRQRYGHSIHPRFVVNPMGVELAEVVERPSGGPVRLLWVGQLIPRKRIDVALAALGRLEQCAWHFDVVGDGLERPALERQAQQLGLGERVRFHGFQPDPGPWYRQADLLLFPSLLENLPVTMLEAMSHGVPCLAMRGDGGRAHNANAEVIEHDADGFLAASDDDFLRQLERLLQQPDRLRSAGMAAQGTIRERHTWDQHLDQYEQLIAELLGARPRAALV